MKIVSLLILLKQIVVQIRKIQLTFVTSVSFIIFFLNFFKGSLRSPHHLQNHKLKILSFSKKSYKKKNSFWSHYDFIRCNVTFYKCANWSGKKQHWKKMESYKWSYNLPLQEFQKGIEFLMKNIFFQYDNDRPHSPFGIKNRVSRDLFSCP